MREFPLSLVIRMAVGLILVGVGLTLASRKLRPTPATAAEICVDFGLLSGTLCAFPYSADVKGTGFETTGVGADCGNLNNADIFFAISSSESSVISTGDLPPDNTLFLWMLSTSGYGFEETPVHFVGDLIPIDYEPIRFDGFLGANETVQIFSGACALGPPSPIGRLTVGIPVSVPEPIGSWGRTKALYR